MSQFVSLRKPRRRGVERVAIAGLVLSVISLIPIMGAIYYWFLRYTAARRILRLTSRGPIDFVATTSVVHTSPRGKGAIISRPLTGLGQVQGVAFGSKAIGKLYRRKEVRVHFSVEVRNRLDEDIFLIGGPLRNQVTKKFLELLNGSMSSAITVDDVSGALRLPSMNPPVEVKIDAAKIAKVPEQDIALVLLARNPFTDRPRRAILCCGVTSYGTAAASEYFFEVLLKETRRIPRNIRKSIELDQACGFIVRIAMSSGKPIGFHNIEWFQAP